MSWHRGEEHGGVARVLQEEGCPGWDHCLGPLGHSPHKVGPGSEIIPLGIHSLLTRKQPRSDRPTSATPPVSLPSCPSPLGGHRGGGSLAGAWSCPRASVSCAEPPISQVGDRRREQFATSPVEAVRARSSGTCWMRPRL